MSRNLLPLLESEFYNYHDRKIATLKCKIAVFSNELVIHYYY